MKREAGHSRSLGPFVAGLAVLLVVACAISAWYVLQACGVTFPFSAPDDGRMPPGGTGA